VVSWYVAPTFRVVGEKDAVTVGSFAFTEKLATCDVVPPGPVAVTVQLADPTLLGPISIPMLPFGVAIDPEAVTLPVQA